MNLSDVTLSSNRLRLTAFAPSDAQDSHAVQTATLTKYMSWDPEPSLEAFAKVWQAWRPEAEAGSAVRLAIRLKTTGEYVGTIGLHDIDTSEPEIGLWIKEARHGQGLGGEAVATVLAYALNLGKASVIYEVDAANLASSRLAEKLGGRVIRREVGRDSKPSANGAEYASLLFRIDTNADRRRSKDKT